MVGHATAATVMHMRIGTMSSTINDGTIAQVVAEAQEAAADGLQSFWAPQIFGHDTLTVLALVGQLVPEIELGTAVVPTYPRHPMMMAQQALTVQAATGGRLALGIGLSHQVVVEMLWGLSYAKPVRHIREYLSVLMPLLEGNPVGFSGEEYQVQGAITVAGSSRPSVLVAALGTQMLNVTGRLADGTSTWCTGVNTLRSHIVPVLNEAAAEAGRPTPRVVAAFPICVTDDVDAARARAAQVFAVYTNLPSYRAMMDLEGVADPSGIAIVGTEAEVRDQLSDVAAAGVTDLNAGVFAGNPDEAERTRAVLRELSATAS